MIQSQALMELAWQDGTSSMVLSAAVDSEEPTMVDEVMECLRKLDPEVDLDENPKVRTENGVYVPWLSH